MHDKYKQFLPECKIAYNQNNLYVYTDIQDL